MRHDPLSDALVTIKNADRVGKVDARVPASRLIGEVLQLLQEKGYISGFERQENGRGGLILTTPQGVINNDQAKAGHTGGRLLAYAY